jgi:hypothetical protein
MPEPVAKPGLNPKDNANLGKSDTAVIEGEGPPEEEFWEKYNKRLEFPLSTVAAFLAHVLIAAVILFGIFHLMDREADRSGVPVKLADINGLDDGGMGSAGSGGEDSPLIRSRDPGITDAINSLADPSKLPEIRQDIKQALKYIDPTGNMPLSESNAIALASLDKRIRDKFLGLKEGSGNEPGSGYADEKGKGPGGTGADSTLGRNMRWVLRFRVTGGHDYVGQLKSMGAVLLFPRPEDPSQLVFYGLGNSDSIPGAPRDGGLAGDRVLGAQRIRFSDARRDAVQGVAGAVGLDFMPRTFWAFFPKSVEQELARLEEGYRNKRSEDIEETIFRVTVRDGRYQFVVDEQRTKR